MMIPNADRASKYTYVFIAHETAHQWWGDIVSWRSYRDQWLSEGFAGILGNSLHQPASRGRSKRRFISSMRESLRTAPVDPQRPGQRPPGHVGPIILGHGWDTSKTRGAYQVLIYNKGALVLADAPFPLDGPTSEQRQRVL